MYSFVVLGLIPGTNITISFTMWLQLALAFGAVMTWFLYKRTAPAALLMNHPSGMMVVRNGKPVPVHEISL
jgi:hypothetical protein